MIRRLGAALALALLLLPVAAATQTPVVTRHVRANGMRVLVREDPSAGVVAVALHARAGSRFETAATAGVTNFLHRVMVRGTSRHTAEGLVEAAERIGGSVEASGDVESAEVRGTALARHWESLLGLVAEVALTPTLPPGEIEKERRLILSQIQTRTDDPFPLALDTMLADLYGPHPYALPRLGWRPSIEGIAREHLLEHYRAVYRPDRLVLAVSGRVDRARVVRAAARLFDKMAPAEGATAEPAPAPGPRGQRRVVEKPVQQAHVLVGFVGPGVAERDYAAVKVLAALLGGGMSGRLFVELRDNRGLAYSLGVLNPTRVDGGFVLAYLGTARENVAAAEAGILRELERVRDHSADEAEVARARAYALGQLQMDRRSNARHAWYLAFFEVIGAGWDFPDRYARALEAVTAADVTAAARRWLTRPTTVVLQPR